VARQVIAGAIGTADNLNPALERTTTRVWNDRSHFKRWSKTLNEDPWTYVGGLALCVPAIAGVVGHLVVHVLAETDLILGQTHFGQVEIDPTDEVAQDGIVDHTLGTRKENRPLEAAVVSPCSTSQPASSPPLPFFCWGVVVCHGAPGVSKWN